jgi:DNA-binding winged helix-turn-helix (wHTH) protein
MSLGCQVPTTTRCRQRRFELVARLEAIARRGKHRIEGSAAIEAGGLHVDCGARSAWRDGCPVEMTAKDFELSVLFLRNIGRLLSRGYLLDTVWGPHAHGLSRTLATHVSRLRKKLGLTPEHGWRLLPVYTRGYRLISCLGFRWPISPIEAPASYHFCPVSGFASGGAEGLSRSALRRSCLTSLSAVFGRKNTPTERACQFVVLSPAQEAGAMDDLRE